MSNLILITLAPGTTLLFSCIHFAVWLVVWTCFRFLLNLAWGSYNINAYNAGNLQYMDSRSLFLVLANNAPLDSQLVAHVLLGFLFIIVGEFENLCTVNKTEKLYNLLGVI